ncbi:MAG: UDP-N-acetylmuramoyl-tripeptide--D-alanyl-D-alanine ligase [Ruminococcaceae bacterium]|nr:UDP-N-acetylmuramoyl-tripeptide--D-alanyl-D-alanine ligase [Oscillospiraceae bacterium]
MKNMSVKDILEYSGGTMQQPCPNKAVLGIVRDNREVAPGIIFAAIKGAKTDGHDYINSAYAAGAPCCIGTHVPEGTKAPVIVVPDVEAALLKIAEKYRAKLSIPIIGITGSSGKTTTKEMTAAVLEQKYITVKTEKNYNNSLGVPLTMFRIGKDTEAAVVELGISHFGDMHEIGAVAAPDIAVFTNIGRSHTDNLQDQDGVLIAKTELLEHMPKCGTVIINADDKRLNSLVINQKKLSYGINSDADIKAEEIKALPGGGTSFVISGKIGTISVSIPAYGRHLVYATLAAAAVAHELKMTAEQIKKGISAYCPEGSRARLIKAGDVLIIDDAYNANPDSMQMSIASASALPGRFLCILGDMFGLGGDVEQQHRECGEAAKKAGAMLLTVGEVSKCMGGMHFSCIEDLTEKLPELIMPGDKILIKASHAMEFDKITDFLLKYYGNK